MVRMNAVLSCADSLTPALAARLTRVEENYSSRMHLEYNGVRVRLDSLIGILSVPCHRGSGLVVIADGADEQAAAEAIRDTLQA